MAQVNPYTTKFEMIDITQTYLELLGNAYWLKVRGNNSGRPLELWALRPDWITVIPGTDTLVKEYEYQEASGARTIFKAEDVIHFKQPNPKSSIYGLPTVVPAMEIIRNLVYSTRWNMNFFYNSARPDFMIMGPDISDEDKEELKKDWNNEFRGIEKAHKFGVLRGESITIKDMNPTMRDMQFPTLTDSMIQQILGAFGVPKAIIGMQGMNRAEAEAQIYTFLSETIEPKVKRICERLNEFLVPEFGDNLHLDYDDPTPENRESLIKEYANALQNNWMVINEVRDREGLMPIDGGWDIYLPLTVTPIGGVPQEPGNAGKTFIKIGGIDAKKYYENKKKKEQEKLRTKVMAGKRKLKLKIQLKKELIKKFGKEFAKRKAFTKEQKQVIWQEHVKLLVADERLFGKLTLGLFKNQEKRLQKALKEEFKNND